MQLYRYNLIYSLICMCIYNLITTNNTEIGCWIKFEFHISNESFSSISVYYTICLNYCMRHTCSKSYPLFI